MPSRHPPLAFLTSPSPLTSNPPISEAPVCDWLWASSHIVRGLSSTQNTPQYSSAISRPQAGAPGQRQISPTGPAAGFWVDETWEAAILEKFTSEHSG